MSLRKGTVKIGNITKIVSSNGGIIPSGTLSIVSNGTYDVSKYANAVVNIPNEDLSSEFDTYDSHLNTQENTIGDIMSSLAGKAVSGGSDNTYWYDFINNNLETFENNEIESLANYAIAYKTNLKTISLPNCKTIGDRTFMQCTGCTSLNLPALETAGQFAFNAMTSLEEVVFPSLTRISHNAFVSSKVKKVDFHVCTYLGFSVFSTVSTFETLIIRTPDVVCQMGAANTLANTAIANGTGYIYVPDDLVDSYKAATNWSQHAAQIKPLSELEG